jgi:hypothetical protein
MNTHSPTGPRSDAPTDQRCLLRIDEVAGKIPSVRLGGIFIPSDWVDKVLNSPLPDLGAT